jgi:DNA-binding response OmpR family regulator
VERPQNDQLSEHTGGEVRGCIMIVNSEPAFARVLQAYLQLQRWSTVVCTAREALRDLSTLQPRALILDFDGPGVDGFDVLEALHAYAAAVPVLICSHHAEPHEPERASLRELGVRRWLRRPCSMQAIAREIDLSLEPRVAPEQSARA